MPKKRSTLPHESTEETRRCILDAAHRLFMEYGYRAVSTRQVAQHCKISQPTLYYHFTDKQAIFVEITLGLLGTMKTELDAIAGSDKGGEVKLTEAARFLLRYAGREMNVNSLLHDIAHEIDDATRSTINQAFFSHVIQPLVAIVNENQFPVDSSSEKKNLPLVTQAFLFLSMVSTLVDQNNELDQQKLGNFVQPGDMAHELTQFYLHGLLGK